MINNLTYRSVDEAAKLGGETLRVFGRLIAHQIDAVMCNVRSPAAGIDATQSGGAAIERRPALAEPGYDAWFVRH